MSADGRTRRRHGAHFAFRRALAARRSPYPRTDVDLALFDSRIPRTALSLTAEGASSGRGQVRGKFAARNAEPGPIDSKRLPILALSSSFESAAGTGDPGSAGSLARQRRPRRRKRSRAARDEARWNLSVRELDLKSIASSLNATRLAGAVRGQLPARHRITRRASSAGELKQAAVALAFDAAVRRGIVDVRRFRAEAHGGSVEGTATLATERYAGVQRQRESNRARPRRIRQLSAGIHFRDDRRPRRVGLSRPGSAALKLKIADGSRLRGLPLSGAGALTVERRAASTMRTSISPPAATG